MSKFFKNFFVGLAIIITTPIWLPVIIIGLFVFLIADTGEQFLKANWKG